MRVALFGRTKAGKSTLGNVCCPLYTTYIQKLLGRPLFPVKANPSTSCACLVHSGPSADTKIARVTVCTDISETDISLIFQNTGISDSLLEKKLKEGCKGELTVDCDEISPCTQSLF